MLHILSVQRANREKLLCIRTHVTWGRMTLELVDFAGGTLYEEYGRHPSLQAAVQRYREAGDPQARQKGAVEWLFHHHVPEESRKLLVNPDVVLSRALFLGCCDMYRVQRPLEGILPGVGESLSRWIRFFQQMIIVRYSDKLTANNKCLIFKMEQMHIQCWVDILMSHSLTYTQTVCSVWTLSFCLLSCLFSYHFKQYISINEAKYLVDDMPLKWIQLLYNKYCHLESLRRVVSEVEDKLKLSEEDMGKVKEWLKQHLGIEKGNVWKSLFECGVPADEIDHWMEEIGLKKIGLGVCDVWSGTDCLSLYRFYVDMWLLPCAGYLYCTVVDERWNFIQKMGI